MHICILQLQLYILIHEIEVDHNLVWFLCGCQDKPDSQTEQRAHTYVY